MVNSNNGQVDLNRLKLFREELNGMIQQEIVVDDSYLPIMEAAQESLKRQGVSIRFDFSQNAGKTRATNDPLKHNVQDLRDRLEKLEERTSILYTQIGNVDAYDDTPIVSLENKRALIYKNLRRVIAESDYQEVEKNISALESDYQKLSENYDHILQDKIKENDGIRAGIDFSFLRNLNAHSLESVRTMGDSLLSLYQKDTIINQNPENIADALTQSKNLNFYKESVDKIKQEVILKEKEYQNNKLYEEYQATFKSLISDIEVALQKEDLQNVQEKMRFVFPKYHLDRLDFSKNQNESLQKLVEKITEKMVEKKDIMVLADYKKLKDYADTHRLDKNKEPQTSENTPKYADNKYSYYNLNQTAKEVEAYNAQKKAENANQYSSNRYSYYDLNQVAAQVSQYNNEKKGTVTPPIQQVQKSGLLDSYLQNPEAFFNKKINEIQTDIILSDSYKSQLNAAIEAEREAFHNLFTVPNSVYDITDLERVRDVLTQSNQKFEEEKAKYVEICQNNPFLIFDRLKKQIQRDRSLSVDAIREMLQYIDQLKDQFSWNFTSHGATLDPNNKEQVEKYMDMVRNMIVEKKNALVAEQNIPSRTL